MLSEQQLATLLEDIEQLTVEVKSTKEAYQTLISEVRTLQDSVGRLDRDLGEDRKDIGDIKIKQGEITTKVDELYQRMNRQTTTIADKVVSSVKREVKDNIATPVLDQLEGIGKEVAKKSKILYIQQKKNGVIASIKSWFKGK